MSRDWTELWNGLVWESFFFFKGGKGIPVNLNWCHKKVTICCFKSYKESNLEMLYSAPVLCLLSLASTLHPPPLVSLPRAHVFPWSRIIEISQFNLWTLVIGFGVQLDNKGWSHFKILNLITFSNPFFSLNKVIFSGSWYSNVDLSFRGHGSTHYSMQRAKWLVIIIKGNQTQIICFQNDVGVLNTTCI